MPTLNPPLPPGGIGDTSLDFGAAGLPSGLGSGLPSLPSLPGASNTTTNSGFFTALGNAAQNISQAFSGANTIGSTDPAHSSTTDGLITRVAFLVLGLVIIAGAIWTYKK